MNANEIGLKVRVNGGACLNFRTPIATLHDAKSTAGRLFHLPAVSYVCVYTPDGVAHLYLRKDANGHCIKREELD